MNAWDSFWGWADQSNIASGIIAGVVVAILLAIPKIRVPVFNGITHFFKWLFSLRIVSKDRDDSHIRMVLDDAEKMRLQLVAHLNAKDREIASLQVKLNDAEVSLSGKRVRIAEAEKAIEQVTALADAQQARADESEARLVAIGAEVAEVRKNLLEHDRKRTISEQQLRDRSEALKQALVDAEERARKGAEPQQAIKLPVPRPRWTVEEAEDGIGQDWLIRNVVPGSVALGVRVESESGMTIQDAGYWEDLSGSADGEFRGERTAMGLVKGVELSLSWYDETGTQCFKELWIPGEGNEFMANFSVV